MAATSEADSSLRPSRRLQAAGIAISLVCIAGVVAWALRQPAPELPSDRAAVAGLLVAIALLAVTTGLRSERWRALIRRAGGEMSAADAYGLTVVGFMGNAVLPARGGDVIRVVIGQPRAATTSRTLIGTLFAERILDVVTLLGLFAVLGLFVLQGFDTPELGPLMVLGILAGTLLTAGGLVFAFRGRYGWAGSVIDFIEPMTTSTRQLLGRHGAGMLAVTAAIWACEAVVWLAASYAAGLDLGALDALYLMALAGVFVLIPSGPGYAGTLDAGVIFGARALGFGGGATLSYLLVLRFVLTVPLTLAGIVLVLVRYGGLKALTGARRRTA